MEPLFSSTFSTTVVTHSCSGQNIDTDPGAEGENSVLFYLFFLLQEKGKRQYIKRESAQEQSKVLGGWCSASCR